MVLFFLRKSFALRTSRAARGDNAHDNCGRAAGLDAPRYSL